MPLTPGSQIDVWGNPVNMQNAAPSSINALLAGPTNAFTAGAQGGNRQGGNGADGWTNLQTYLGLNPGAGKAMGNTVLNPIEQGGASARYNIASANQAGGVAPSGVSGAQANLAPQVNSATQQANLLGSVAGQQTLLGNRYGSQSASGYGPGQSGLDQLFFGSDAKNQQRVKNDTAAYGGNALGQQLGQMTGYTPPPPPANGAVVGDQRQIGIDPSQSTDTSQSTDPGHKPHTFRNWFNTTFGTDW